MVMNNSIKRKIISLLRDEGCLYKAPLIETLKNLEHKENIDWESVLEELVDDEIIHLASVPKFSGEILFLIGDYVMGRGKPIQILKNPGQHGLPEDLMIHIRKKWRNFLRIMFTLKRII